MTDTPPFSVDLDTLEALAARMRGYLAAIADRLAEFEQKAKDVEGVWVGDAAEAYREAQSEWLAGVTDMKEGLAVLEASIRAVHSGYTDAMAENRKILGI
ncbi:WXG100 family type VII secretion target [Nocardia sp. NPDC127579]|uniref:WXG100 family type VII secretion target n=1 Tax=Nocardia sp. NPDC127579 TaxID=3345402 RepID=UPI0036255EA9